MVYPGFRERNQTLPLVPQVLEQKPLPPLGILDIVAPESYLRVQH